MKISSFSDCLCDFLWLLVCLNIFILLIFVIWKSDHLSFEKYFWITNENYWAVSDLIYFDEKESLETMWFQLW